MAESPTGTRATEDADDQKRESVAEVLVDAKSKRRLAWHTRLFLVVFYGIGFAVGATDPPESSDLDFILSVGMAFSMAWWTITDASDRGHPFRLSIRLLVIAFGGFAAPLYLLWTRRLMGVVWIALVAAGLLLASEAGYFVSLAVSGGLNLLD